MEGTEGPPAARSACSAACNTCSVCMVILENRSARSGMLGTAAAAAAAAAAADGGGAAADGLPLPLRACSAATSAGRSASWPSHSRRARITSCVDSQMIVIRGVWLSRLGLEGSSARLGRVVGACSGASHPAALTSSAGPGWPPCRRCRASSSSARTCTDRGTGGRPGAAAAPCCMLDAPRRQCSAVSACSRAALGRRHARPLRSGPTALSTDRNKHEGGLATVVPDDLR
jgi:hypothetical protein